RSRRGSCSAPFAFGWLSLRYCTGNGRYLTPPVALEDEGSPVVGSPPAPVSADGELRFAQGRGGRLPFDQQGAVETAHQLGRGAVLDAPEARHHAGGPGVEEAAGQADQSFTP